MLSLIVELLLLLHLKILKCSALDGESFDHLTTIIIHCRGSMRAYLNIVMHTYYCMSLLAQGRTLNSIMKLGRAGEKRGTVSIANLYII